MKNKKIKDIEVVKKDQKVKLSKEEKLKLKQDKKEKRKEQKELTKEMKNTLPSTRKILHFIDIDKENKKKKKKKKKIKKKIKNTLPSTRKILPFIDIDEEDVFITKQGYLDIYQINTRDTTNLSESERKVYVYSFIAFLRNFVEDF